MRVTNLQYYGNMGLGLLSIILMAVSAVLFRDLEGWHAGATAMVTGFLIMGLALVLVDRPMLQPTSPHKTMTAPLRIGWIWIVLGVWALLVVAEWSGGLLTTYNTSNHLQFGVFVLGVTFIGAGAAGWYLRLPRLRVRFASAGLALLLIIAAALALRLWHLETAVHYFIDEINFGRPARFVAQGNRVPLISPFSDVAAFPWMYPYWQAHGIWAMGQTLSALRIVSVIIGTLTIPAFYLLVKTLFSVRIALLAALLLATFPPHIHFSRVGINNIADVLAGLLLLAFLARGLQTRRQSDFALAGLALGMTQYFYEGGRVVYPLLAVLWLAAQFALRIVRFDRALVQRMALTAVTGVIIAMPVYYTLLAQQLPLFPRYQTTGLGGSYHRTLLDFDAQQTVEQHLTWPLLIYVQMAERSQFYGGETPLLLVFVVPFALLGLAYALWRLRHPGLVLAVIWLLLVSTGSAVLANSAYAARYVVVLPALMIFTAVGVIYITGKRWTLAFVLAGMLAVASVSYYFGTHLTDFNRQLRPLPDIQDALFRADELPSGGQICLVTGAAADPQFVRDISDYVAPHIKHCIIHPDALSPEIVDSLIESRPFVVFFVEPDDQININLMQSTGLHGPFFSPYDTVPENRQFARYNTPLP